MESSIFLRDIKEKDLDKVVDLIHDYIQEFRYADRPVVASLQDIKIKSTKCLFCSKTYKLPRCIFAPRQFICASCEWGVERDHALFSAFSQHTIY